MVHSGLTAGLTLCGGELGVDVEKDALVLVLDYLWIWVTGHWLLLCELSSGHLFADCWLWEWMDGHGIWL